VLVILRSLLLSVSLALLPAAAAQAATVLVYGDSLSSGYGLPRDEGWVRLLAKRLQAAGRYRVVNASITGETTTGGAARIASTLQAHRPSVVILELGANDGLRGQPLDAMRRNLVSIISACRNAHARVLLVGMRLPPNYGPTYVEQFHQVFVDVARSERVPFVPFLLEGFAGDLAKFQADGIHPAAAAQPRMLDNVWPTLQPLLK
jgi:acyl-CoA thioesterase-1